MTSPIQPIRVESIMIDGRLRKLREDVVTELMGSIREIGLINPLLIRRPDGHLVPHLVAGWHRLEAVRRLGWELVPCCTLDADDLLAEINEIDENLQRADLTSAERSMHTARRKELYEALHPETKHGAIGGGHTQSGQLGHSVPGTKSPRYTATAKGSERTTRREAQRAKRIPSIAKTVGTSLDNGVELDALAKLPPDQQEPLIARAAAGEAVSAKHEPLPCVSGMLDDVPYEAMLQAIRPVLMEQLGFLPDVVLVLRAPDGQCRSFCAAREAADPRRLMTQLLEQALRQRRAAEKGH